MTTTLNAFLNHRFTFKTLALLSGALLPFAFAPFNFYIFAVISPALLLWLWLNSSIKQAFVLGWLYGLGFYGIGVSWVFISIHRYGNTDIPLAVIFTAAFVAFLAIFSAFQGLLFNWLYTRNTKAKILLAFPSTWVIFEFLRSFIFTGFPWLILGDSQTDSPLSGLAPVLGEYGLSFLITFSSALIVTSFLSLLNTQEDNSQKTFSWRPYFYVFCLLLIWITAGSLSFKHWTKIKDKPFKVSLIQGNVPQDIKWSREHTLQILALYPKLTNAHWDNQLIIWPEGAVPAPMQTVKDYIESIDKEAKKHKTTILLGLPVRAENGFKYYNSLLTLGVDKGIYYKKHLVPFGEYVPFENILRGLIGFFNIPMSDFINGPQQQAPIVVNNIKLGIFICYEIAYSHLVREAARNSEMLITISDDAWFGDSLAPAQHLQIARMRALQTGRMLLLGTNNGITAIISAEGKVIAKAPQFQVTALSGIVQAYEGTTPWMKMGDMTILIIALAGLIVASFISINKE